MIGSTSANDAPLAAVLAGLRAGASHITSPTSSSAATAGVMLDTPERIRAAAPRIQQQAVSTQAMPLGNLTHMTDEERTRVARWVARGAPVD